MKLHIKILCTFFSCFSFLVASDTASKLDMLTHFQRPYKAIVVDYNPFMKEELSNHTSSTPYTHATDKNALHLLGIINNKAFISGRWYRVGDTIDGGKVMRIENEKVEIQKEKQIQTLRFEEAKSVLHVKDNRK